jgi:hypothetical protein
MKYLYLILALLFISFAIVQYNDPDPHIWVAYYLGVAAFCFVAFLDRSFPRLLFIFIVLTWLWAFSYIPATLEWFREGSPSITDSMKAETPFIENMREFLGLALCGFVLIGLYRRHRKARV